MKSSLIPEQPLLIYPTLAATLGLDEAVMLSVLSTLANAASHSGAVGPNHIQLSNGFQWLTLDLEKLREAMPFWDDRDLQRVSKSLHDKGVLLMGGTLIGSSSEVKFAFNERSGNSNTNPAATRPAPARAQPNQGKNHIANNWQPDQATLTQLAQHNIPSAFAFEQVPEFITYWRERGEAQRSWGAKFMQHVIREWRQFEARRNRQDQNSPMQRDWQPSLDAMEVLTLHAGIRREFVEDAIPEFILYWQERGDSLKTWNSKFIQHVRLQWKKFNSALEHSTDPKPVPVDWQPSEDVYDVLRLANIELSFAQSLIPEFVLYWRDSNQLHTSWNTRFLQHAKREWARRHALSTAQNSLSTATNTARSTRDISLDEQLNDRSWAL